MAHRCIKPQCPNDCSECNHALPDGDEAAMLVCDLLDAFAVDGFDGPLEDGESQLVDRARAWLAARHVGHNNAIKQAKREALLEAAEVWEVIGYSKFKTPSEELRRMAEKT